MPINQNKRKKNKEIKKNNNYYFILEWVNDEFWKLWKMVPIGTTASNNNKLKGIDNALTLWIYNDTKNKNFYKLWYWIENKEKQEIIAIILSYPLIPKFRVKYNKYFFSKLDKLSTKELNSINTIILTQLSENGFKIKKFIQNFINGVNCSEIKKIVQISFKIKNKQKKTLDKVLTKEELKLVKEYWLETTEKLHLFTMFFYNLFKMADLLGIKTKRQKLKLFFALFNFNVLFFKKIDFPTDSKEIDLTYFKSEE